MSLPPALDPPGILHGEAALRCWNDRAFQGIPSIAAAPGGRLWLAWYGGARDEGCGNIVGLVCSGDGGATWSAPVVVVQPPPAARAFDPALWCDTDGRLWLFWAQSASPADQRVIFDGVGGVWALRTSEPDAAEPHWEAPRRIADGIMMNRPTVLRDGTWLFPVTLWRDGLGSGPATPATLADACLPHVVASRDHGATFERRGGPQVEGRDFDEHMLVELRDGRLWLLTRILAGMAGSISDDGGRSWTPARPIDLGVPNSRFHVRRLRSGRLLLIVNLVDPAERGTAWATRKNLSALLSDDDGASWTHRLLLDARSQTSYPDADEDADGRIWITYDRDRYGSGDILLACIREADVLSGACHAPGSFLARVADHSGGVRG
jgi:hypothetical protein